MAGIVITAGREHLSPLCETLRGVRGVLEVRRVPETDKLAVVLESPSAVLQQTLERMLGLAHVLALEVAFVNYEDDLDSEGHMDCPPHTPRTHAPTPPEDGPDAGGLQ